MPGPHDGKVPVVQSGHGNDAKTFEPLDDLEQVGNGDGAGIRAAQWQVCIDTN
jgi:hypothetical protein